jgi:steroid 5-alpha reductase family enzyme
MLLKNINNIISMGEFSELFSNYMPLIYGIISVVCLFVLTWLVSVLIKNASIVDWIWGAGFAVQAMVYVSKDSEKGINYPRIIFSALIILHGLRLSIYIAIRGWSKGEDKRYKEIFRDKLGKNMWWASLFMIFLFQSIINLVVGFVIYTFNSVIDINKINIGVFFFGAAIMLIGTLYETIADLQLYFFKKNPNNSGKVLNSGLWYYCRHPNYFGESVFWVGCYICNLSALIWFTFFSPVLMIFFIVYVSGVPILERGLSKDYEGKYGDYIGTTSSFIPWCKLSPKKEIQNDNVYQPPKDFEKEKI